MSVRAYILDINQRDVKKFIDFFHDSKLANTIYMDEMWYLYFHDKNSTVMTIHDKDISLKKAQIKADKKGWDLKDTDEYDDVYNKGLPDNTHGRSISLDNENDESEKIIKMVCYYFGGYYKKSDVVKGKYVYIEKNYGNIIKGVFE